MNLAAYPIPRKKIIVRMIPTFRISAEVGICLAIGGPCEIGVVGGGNGVVVDFLNTFLKLWNHEDKTEKDLCSV